LLSELYGSEVERNEQNLRFFRNWP